MSTNKPTPSTPSLSYEQQRALEQMHRGDNIFLTGGAGTGKSTVIRAYEETTKKRSAKLAPTGAAAARIKGATIHSTFGLRQRGYLPDYKSYLPAEQADYLRDIETLIIDEVSMVRVDVLNAIDMTLRHICETNLLFGGKQVILVGDLYQLSPIAREEEKIMLEECYEGILPFYAPCWRYGNFTSIILREIHRQADPLFANLLNEIRTGGTMDYWGPASWQTAIDKLNSLLHIAFEAPKNAVVLCAINAHADSLNTIMDANISSASSDFYAHCSGEVYFNEIGADEVVSVRVGSRVLLTANRINQEEGGFDYTNGDQGIVTEIKESAICIRLDRGRSVEVNRHVWETTRFHYDKETKTKTEEVIGSCWQFPIRLGYAISIHKSQGMSLDNVNLRLTRQMFAPGMLYVALSRCRSLAGLSLSRPLFYGDVIPNPAVDAFYASLP
ncbi:MAG: hypothetical protein RL095_304 [Verrucomicrobiota bacterium]|jgi:ATP-dependent exoDNAse (exonuclease V) alpha subunit